MKQIAEILGECERDLAKATEKYNQEVLAIQARMQKRLAAFYGGFDPDEVDPDLSHIEKET